MTIDPELEAKLRAAHPRIDAIYRAHERMRRRYFVACGAIIFIAVLLTVVRYSTRRPEGPCMKAAE